MALPPVDVARWTAFSVTGPLPNSLEMRTRSSVPLSVGNTIWRSVLPERPGLGGRLLGSVSWGPDAQAPTQCMALPPPVPPTLVVSLPPEPVVVSVLAMPPAPTWALPVEDALALVVELAVT